MIETAIVTATATETATEIEIGLIATDVLAIVAGMPGQEALRLTRTMMRPPPCTLPLRSSVTPMLTAFSAPLAAARGGNLYEGPQRTYKQFLELQDDSITPAEAEKKYEEYTTEYRRRQLRGFFEEHKQHEWFREKYDPSYLERRRAERIEATKAALASFTRQLQDGTLEFKCEVDEESAALLPDTAPASTSTASTGNTSSSSGSGSASNKEAGEAEEGALEEGETAEGKASEEKGESGGDAKMLNLRAASHRLRPKPDAAVDSRARYIPHTHAHIRTQ